MASEPEPLSWAVFRLAAELRRHLHDLLVDERWVADGGFRPPCLGVLHAVIDRGPISQREISDRLSVDPSDVVGALDILERAGLVERGRDPEDRRRHAVVATPAGRRAGRRLGELRAEAEDRALAGLDASERRQLTALIGKALDRAGVDVDPFARLSRSQRL